MSGVDLATQLRRVADREGFAGVVRVQVDGTEVAAFAQGYADRSTSRPNNLDTRFAIASGTKGLTALTIMSLVADGELELDTLVSDVVGDVLPVVDSGVTIDHLLTHRSGVGDYLDEETLGDIDDHVLGDLSPHVLTAPSAYLRLLNRYPQRNAPGEVFAYNNSGYVILSIVIEQVSGNFHREVQSRVLDPAGMKRSGFFRTDNLPGDVALGYLEDGRSNVFHLPVIGAGDGGAYMSVADAESLWRGLAQDWIVSHDAVDQMMTAVTTRPNQSAYGRGFWMDDLADHVWLEGMDAGVSFQTGWVKSKKMTYTVLANTSAGAWPLARTITAFE